MTLRARFLAFDDHLASLGVPPLTSWWRDGIGQWLDAYEGRHVLELVACVGRGAAKSTAIYKLATFFSLFGDFTIPPGERHFAIVLSRLKEEATKGLAVIDNWLALLGVPHHLAGEVIELEGQPRGIRVVAASVSAASGWRAYFVAKDERSKWPQGGVADEDAGEIDGSAAAMTATHPLAPIVAVGSAWGASGEFYDAVMAGTDDGRVVLGPTPTWIAAPHVTEADCRRRERDPRRFAREYQCCFSAGAGAAFSADEIERLPRGLANARPLGTAAMFLDSSSGRGDAWTWCCAQHVIEADGPTHDGFGIPTGVLERRSLYIDGQGAITGRFGEVIPFPVPVERMAAIATATGIRRVISDQYQAYPLRSEFAKYGMELVDLAWNAPALIDAAAMLRTMLAERTISAQPGEETKAMCTELLELEEKLTPTGALTVKARRTRRGHADRASLCMLVARAEGLGLIAGSPRAPNKGHPCISYDPYSNEVGFD